MVFYQILCRCVMQRLIHDDSQFEVYMLSHWQPMKLSEDGSDMVTMSDACNEPSCSILHRLQTLKQVVCNGA